MEALKYVSNDRGRYNLNTSDQGEETGYVTDSSQNSKRGKMLDLVNIQQHGWFLKYYFCLCVCDRSNEKRLIG